MEISSTSRKGGVTLSNSEAEIVAANSAGQEVVSFYDSSRLILLISIHTALSEEGQHRQRSCTQGLSIGARKTTLVRHNRWSVRERPEIEKNERTGSWSGSQDSKKAVGERRGEP
jgi:hypothetical protein